MSIMLCTKLLKISYIVTNYLQDQVLLGMQEKLDNLCEQVNYFKDKPDISSYSFECSGCGCQHCNHHQPVSEYKEVRNEVRVEILLFINKVVDECTY